MAHEQQKTGGNGEINITMAPDAGEAGMAVMMAEMIRTNIHNHPERLRDLAKIDGNVWITANDAETEMTLTFDNGSMKVYGSKVGKPILQIATDSSTLLDLANIQIKFGLPYYFDDVGRMVLKKLLTRQLKIKGMLSHNLELTHLTKMISVK